MARRRPSRRLRVARDYAPLAVLVAVGLIATNALPSKIKPAPAADMFPAGVAEQPLVPGGSLAGAPAAVATAGTTGAPRSTSAARAQAPDPAHNRAVSPGQGVLPGVRAGRDCAGGGLQDPIGTYSPTCLDFTGDNGGATAPGVTANTITVTMRGQDTSSKQDDNSELAKKAKSAGIAQDPAAQQRTLDALVAYFNKTYQLYGRQVKVVKYTGRGSQLAEFTGGGQEQANADALKAAQELHAFADLSATSQPYLDALVRQKVIAIGGVNLPASYYRAKAPYAWGQLIDCTALMNSAVDLLAKRFPAGQPAVRAGSTATRGQTRKFALLVPDDPVYQKCVDEAAGQLRAAGISFAKQIHYAVNFTAMQQEAPNIAAQLKQAGITTVVLVTDPILPYFLTGAATQQDFWPEWFVTGTIGTDIDVAGQFYDQDQWQNAYGQSYLVFGQGPASPAYKAYKSMRAEEPASIVDVMYQTLLMLFTGLQEAGPNLTPQSFEQGMFSWGPHVGAYGRWSFSPNDFTSTDDAREVYYDPRAISAFNSRPGAWVALNGGKRYRGATWPAGDPGAPIPPAASS
ncbi:MAG TPA: hypothetical protein VGJ14_07070 [Sporichthyaceae bacterium]